jgi:DNA recombination protein RmuC
MSPNILVVVLLALVGGALVGAAVAAARARHAARERERATREMAEAIAAEILKTRDAERQADIDRTLERIKSEFGSISLSTMKHAQDALVALARERLGATLTESARDIDGKKGLIDQTLAQLADQMTKELAKVAETMKTLEKDREGKFADLSAHLANAHAATRDLTQTAASLREALSSTKARGAWGERMAEDVLQLAGFVEGVNYRKQATLDGNRGRPDFTFLLPNDLTLNMDVKFPLENYARYLEATTDGERDRCRAEFVRDARRLLKQVQSRNYIDPESNTVDCVLLFIPNEQVYGFLHESDRTLVDEAVKHHVVLCSPFTLYAVLALIRQAFDNFQIERRSREFLVLLAEFQKQWLKFKEQMEKMGRRIDDAQREFDALTTTRSTALDRTLGKIDEMRQRESAGRELPEDDEAPQLGLEMNDIPSRAGDAAGFENEEDQGRPDEPVTRRLSF